MPEDIPEITNQRSHEKPRMRAPRALVKLAPNQRRMPPRDRGLDAWLAGVLHHTVEINEERADKNTPGSS